MDSFDRKTFRHFLFEYFDMTEELFLDRIFRMFNPDMDTAITRYDMDTTVTRYDMDTAITR